jgi:TetR/AcrR family transcriptional repressor of mexCD-oprJ operon
MTDESELLKRLATALVDKPRSTIKELAEALGMSKATLHRFCGTRENLEAMIASKAQEALLRIIVITQHDFPDYKVGLTEIIAVHYQEYELLRLQFSLQACADEAVWTPYMKAVDAFFLKGQKQGAFRIDFSVAFLSEVFIASICGLIDAERRGRVAKSGMAEAFEDFFLKGTQK